MDNADTPAIRAEELARHRAVLLRFAMAHLRDAAAAEDAVQDTFVAALQAAGSFRGGPPPRTWLIGILKRKLVDRARRSGREVPLPGDGDGDPDEAGLLTRLFDHSGHWAGGPRHWGEPEAALEHEGFWRALETCIAALPPRAARVFTLRELVSLEPDEVCKESGITASNYWVTMHRARLRLRDCLEQRWFGTPSGEERR